MHACVFFYYTERPRSIVEKIIDSYIVDDQITLYTDSYILIHKDHAKNKLQSPGMQWYILYTCMHLHVAVGVMLR